MSCLYVGGVPGISAKIGADATEAFVTHMRSHYRGSFTVVFNAGIDSGWAYDLCSGAGSDFETAVQSFAPPV